MYLTLEWKGELLYCPVRDIHQSGMVVVEGPEEIRSGETSSCLPLTSTTERPESSLQGP